MAKYEKHIFVCTNQRDASSPRGCCDPQGKAALQGLLKQKLSERGLKTRFRANKAGCLDQCEHGPNMVIYPDAVWYGGVRANDLDEIIESHLLCGVPVARLMLKDECINTKTCEHRRPKEG
jgi:(2Fe-2S) ferredoxin